MQRSLMFGFCLLSACSLDTKPLASAGNSVTADRNERATVERVPSLSQSARSSMRRDAGALDAGGDPTQIGSSKPALDAAMPHDAAAAPSSAMMTPPPVPAKNMDAMGGTSGSAVVSANAGAGAAGAAAVAGSSAAGSGGAAGLPQAGAGVPTTKQALVGVLNERAAMNGADALVMRALVTQIDTPFPANAASLRLLLGTAITSFGCPQMNARECGVICDYAGDSCLTCVADQECRGQLVVVCPNSLTKCLP